MTISLLLSAFLLGLLGSIHCIGMCGGIAGALGMAIKTSSSQRKVILQLGYSFGRISTYAFIGLVGGLFATLITFWQTEFMLKLLRIATSVLLILLGLYIAGWWRILTHIEQLGHRLWRYLAPLTKRLMPVEHVWQSIALGGLWGWLPCGLIYSSLIWASSYGNAGLSALLMGAFGLGTLPALLVTGSLSYRLRKWIAQKKTREFAGFLLILFGLWTLAPISGLQIHQHGSATDELVCH